MWGHYITLFWVNLPILPTSSQWSQYPQTHTISHYRQSLPRVPIKVNLQLFQTHSNLIKDRHSGHSDDAAEQGPLYATGKCRPKSFHSGISTNQFTLPPKYRKRDDWMLKRPPLILGGLTVKDTSFQTNGRPTHKLNLQGFTYAWTNLFPFSPRHTVSLSPPLPLPNGSSSPRL